MKRKINRDVQRFFNIEADVADDEDGEDTENETENEMMLQFLDDETVASDHGTDPTVEGNDDEETVASEPGTYPTVEGNDDETSVPNKFWDEYLDRARIRGRPEGDQAESHHIESLLPLVTKPDDYPLWKIPCRVGMEYTAVHSLFKTARARHQVRSVVIRDSIPGYIYVEATMNTALTNLLLITPGIIKSHGRLRKRGIECSEFADLFKMNNDSTQFRKGVWVSIQQGLYEGDVGLVVGTKDWCIEVLVVPRLTITNDHPQKRKRSTLKPSPNLFDPSKFPSTKVVHDQEDHYILGSLRMEHGLCRKVYDFAALVGNVQTITFPLFKRFLLSKHPAVIDIDIPRPQEWIFDINDWVEILSSGRAGQVTAVYPLYLEVNREVDLISRDGYWVDQDLERVRWYNIRKVFKIGDYVRVTGGPYVEECGWVLRIEKTNAVLTLAGAKRGGEGAPYKIEEIIVPINCLKATPTPHECSGGRETGNPYVGREMQSPWIGRDVVVTKEQHPSKGYCGTVKDVVRSDLAGKSINLIVEFGGIIRPGLPFERIFIPSEYVEEVLSQPHSKDNPPPSPPAIDTTTDLTVSKGNSSDPEHVLLRSCFEGLEVKAIVKGGVFEVQKERLVQILKIDDRLIFRTKNQRTVVTLEHDWVTVVHPKARGDNNLLVHITGEHLGKFSRRIHHRDGISGPVSIYVAFVKRHPNSSDSLSGEETEAPMSHFAIVSETKAEKDHKNELMESLRNRWRGK